jgi:uncharacterized protein (DUF58 family)
MLTKRGWGLLAGSMVLGGAGRTLGVVELFVLAAGGAGLLLLAVVAVVTRGRVRVEGRRRLVPARVHAGSDSRVELEVVNAGARPSPVLTLRDTVVAERGANAATPRMARFQLAPLEPDESNRAAYRLGAERRGVFRVGPLEAVAADPFGLVAVTSEAAATTELTVYPRVERVAPPPLTTGHDPRSGAGHATFLGHGDEFYGLRAYEVGDDLRQVHWPSTARQDELMIRQHELPWQGRATVLVDTRHSIHDEASFEAAVSAAASLLTACWKRDSQVRLLTTDGLDSRFGSGTGHIEAAMEHLAVVEPGRDRLDALVPSLRRRATGALVVVTTSAGAAGVAPVVAAAAGFGWAAVVAFRRQGAAAPALPFAGLQVVVDPGQPFGDAWNRALAATPAGMGRR